MQSIMRPPWTILQHLVSFLTINVFLVGPIGDSVALLFCKDAKQRERAMIGAQTWVSLPVCDVYDR
jgi:hypothetical protein